MIKTTGKWLLAIAFLVPGTSVTAMAQQNSGSDIPKSKPHSNNPDLQQQSGQNDGKAVPNAGGSANQSTNGNAGPNTGGSANQSTTQSTKGGKRDKKKPHNPQTHGAQKHDPSNQS